MFRKVTAAIANRLPSLRRQKTAEAPSVAQLQQREKNWERVYVAALLTSAALLVLVMPFLGVLAPAVSYLVPTGASMALMGVQAYAVWRGIAAEKQWKAMSAEAPAVNVAPDVAAPAAASAVSAPPPAADFNQAADKVPAPANAAPAATPAVKTQDKPAP